MSNKQSNKRRQSRSPIKDSTLRLPGQSLEEERAAIWDDKVEPYAFSAICFVAIAALGWWRVWMHMPPFQWTFSLFALGCVSFTTWRVWRYWPLLRDLHLGIEGERAVGQFLERLCEQGYHVRSAHRTDGCSN